MLKKLMSITVLFVVFTTVFTPMCDTALTAAEITIPLIIGIVITRLYSEEILTADNTAVRIKSLLSAAVLMAVLLSLAAVEMIEIEALDWNYVKFNDAMIIITIMGIAGVVSEIAARGAIKMIRRFVTISTNK